jgi:uncharacterized protein
MDRLFLDANILFLASYKETSPLADFWSLADVQLLTSNFVLLETWQNSTDPEQRLRLVSFVQALELVSEQTADEELVKSAGLPPKDVPVLHAAISGRATHLITADKRHFGSLFNQSIGGVMIERAGDYLRRKKMQQS